MMLLLITVSAALVLPAGLGWCLLNAGLRAGDHAGDATVTASLGPSGQPGEPRPVVIATVRNPGDMPLMAGFSATRRLIPGWLDGGTTVRTARRTMRRRFRAPAHQVVGVIAAGSDAKFAVPVARLARRYLLTAVIGQAGGRLRIFRVPVTSQYRPGPSGPGSDGPGSGGPGSGGTLLAHPPLDDGLLS